MGVALIPLIVFGEASPALGGRTDAAGSKCLGTTGSSRGTVRYVHGFHVYLGSSGLRKVCIGHPKTG